MPTATQTRVTCPNCGTQYPAIVEMIIDVQENPDAKMRLLTGRLNTVQCPNCGVAIVVATPLVYHDAEKELLITFVPMELGIPKDQQEKVIGDLLRQMPTQSMKGYFFQPRQALTMQGLIEQILHADGVTPEMMEQQRERARLIEQFLQTPDAELEALVKEHDADIDGTFLQTMGLFAQQAIAGGQQQAAEAILATQQRIMQLSTYGQEIIADAQQQEAVVREVEQKIRALGQQPTRADFMKLVLEFAEQDEHLQALVGLVRPAFDYQFFNDMTTFIGQAPADERDSLETLRDRLVELTQAVDEEAQVAMQESAALLQAILQNPEPDAFIQENAALLDDTFMAVLSANIQHAEQQGNIEASARLKDIYQKVMQVLQASMSPELRFINQLLSAPSQEEADKLLKEQVSNFGPGLLDLMDALMQAFEARGESMLVDRVKALRGQAAAVLAN
ncbi:MAG: CpXC domain-containing protein [Anaerolineae bacterium]|nr:CpXC domain-containing protein [Anaerolineae bacterium]